MLRNLPAAEEEDERPMEAGPTDATFDGLLRELNVDALVPTREGKGRESSVDLPSPTAELSASPVALDLHGLVYAVFGASAAQQARA